MSFTTKQQKYNPYKKNTLFRVSVHFEGDNPLEFLNYIIAKNYDIIKLSLIPCIK
jgi:hypothetical protein